jgi:HlyD family secretion protein
MKKKLIPLAVILVAGALVGKYVASRKTFRFAGTVEATEVSPTPEIAAAIAAVDVREGDEVKTGQVLARLECADFKIAADLAQRDFARTEKLLKEGSASQEVYDRSLNRRDDTALKVRRCEIASPIDGTVIARLREPKEWAAQGTKILTLVDLEHVYAFFYVPQTQLHKISPGQDVAVFLPEAGGGARKGRVAFIRPEAEFTPKNVQTRDERSRLVYGIKVALDNADRALKPGMPVEAEFSAE